MFRTAAHVYRLKGAVLADFELALAHQLQRGGKGAGDCRDALFGRREIPQQIMLHRRPVSDLADHLGQQLTGIGQRPDCAPLDRHLGNGMALAQRRIGGQEIIKARRISGLLPVGNMLGRAAHEDIAAEAIAVDEAVCRLAHGFEAFQAEGERCCQLLAGRAVILGLLGNEQLRLEIGKPGCHDEVIGCKLDADTPGAFDEQQILLGERQHRNARQIDLLVAGEIEQQVERAFEAGDVDHQRRLMAGALGTVILPQLVHRRCRLRTFRALDCVHLAAPLRSDRRKHRLELRPQYRFIGGIRRREARFHRFCASKRYAGERRNICHNI